MPFFSGSPFILGCSPRAGGNTDEAARLFARGFSKSAGFAALPLFLRDHRVEPCVSCYACTGSARAAAGQKTPSGAFAAQGDEFGAAFGCPLSLRDQSAPLLRALYGAPALCLAAPIYFYHLPAVLKALVDRTQPFWTMHEAGDSRLRNRPWRTCHVILAAARHKGEQLFTGSLLTLRTALAPLRVKLAEPLLLRGLDGPGDLAADSGLADAVLRYGEAAGRNI